jgi:hypothetical protein
MVRLGFFIAACLPLLCGCVMVEVGVTNPVVGLTTVAVTPFFNLSQERAVDGRRFALAYYTELQKTPGFQVIPLGVVEQTMFDHRLEMNNPADVLRLSQLLGADAVVVGAVTDYSPYYPPRIGMQVSWYSPRPWQFYPGIPTDEFARDIVKPPRRFSLFKSQQVECEECSPAGATTVGPPVVTSRGQSPDGRAEGRTRTVSLPEFLLYGEDGAPRQVDNSQEVMPNPTPRELEPLDLPAPRALPDGPIAEPSLGSPSDPAGKFQVQPAEPFDPTMPLMSYTRIFDGADPKLTARLRDYVELSGDLRAGGWEGHLQRSEDFIRFSAHVMIIEMLQLHGGEARKRVVFKLRKYR